MIIGLFGRGGENKGGAMAKVRCDIRCKKCNRLLCKGCVHWLEIKCPRCGHLQSVCTEDAEEGGHKKVVLEA